MYEKQTTNLYSNLLAVITSGAGRVKGEAG